jgi:hypothetical protein
MAILATPGANIAPPNVLTPKDPLAPPYPLSHARILYDNKFNGASTSIAAAQGITNANTYERWRRTGSDIVLIVTQATPQTIDSICLGAHNLGSIGTTIAIATSSNTSGPFTTRATLTPDNDNAIMVLIGSNVTVQRIRLTFSGTVGANEIGVLYAGIAMVMLRPIFGGHAPITLQNKTTYVDSASEDGQWLGRTIARKGYQTSYKWQFITGTWYRQNFTDFINVSNKQPFFIAWRPDLYPDEVGYCWRTSDIAVTNRGGATDYVDFDLPVLGYAAK